MNSRFLESQVVLVPGAAAPAGINTIKSLKMSNFAGKIVATDSTSLSAGFFMADVNEILPEADAQYYVKRLFEIVEKHHVQVLMPSSGYDIYPYSDNREALAKIGATAVVSDRDTLEICRDKLLTYKKMSGKYNLPFTTADPDKVKSFPVIAKPRFGKGSRNVIKVNNEADLRYISSNFGNTIFQEFLPGVEYTIDVLSDMNKKPIISVPRIRLQTKAGISTKGRIIRDADLETTCMNMAREIGIRGPSCIQMKESSEEQLKLIEINSRLGGGTIFSTLAGANIPSMILEMLSGTHIDPPRVSEITVVRYYEEIVIENGEWGRDRRNKDVTESNLLSKPRLAE
ncbi:MAG: ATP-grasp domain-containing protein [Nitrososphaeraceae archaeon]